MTLFSIRFFFPLNEYILVLHYVTYTQKLTFGVICYLKKNYFVTIYNANNAKKHKSF